ncbi:MAG: S8 family serine peptidase [Bacteroidales bacterium]|nr:S8 family serine peptidase [Bacteroidales bacterium]
MNSKLFFLSAISFIISLSLIAQQKTNVEKLNQLSDQFSKDWALKQARVYEFAANNNLQVRIEDENGRIIQMVDVEDGIPVYISTTNLGAAITTRTNELWEGGNLGLDLSGEGYDKLGEWDGGKVRTTHQEFNDGGSSRVTQMDNTSSISDHATHVAGTMVASGVVPNAKGMSYEGLLKAWDWNSDMSEMASAAAAGLEISNHSYEFITGWHHDGSWTWYGNASISPDEDYKFGFYGSLARSADIVAFNAPNYLITVAAANNRGEGPSNAGQGGNAEKDGGEDGYDCLPNGYSTSKNVLTVGAVYELLNYTSPEEVSMSSFSGWGPADDGRIKPDIVAKGVQVYSSLGNSNNTYASFNGTSMATPNTAGTLALLQQHYQDLNGGTPMRAATLKALVIHTADEAGPDPGPDYMFGWGLLNAQRATQLITDDQEQNVIDELELEEGVTYDREINVPDGVSDLTITICWTDPAGFPVGAQLDPLDPMLINDLDISIVDENLNSYYPYKLDPLNPSAQATNDSKNAVDNIEMVYISEPTAGTYTIYVDHDGSLQGNEQAFSIIISGIDEYDVLPECAGTLISPENNSTEVVVNQWISWTNASFASSYDVYFGTDGEGIDTPTSVFNGENFPTNGFSYVMDISTTYYLQVIPRNNVGAAESCDEIWSFTTMDAISEFPYVQDIEGVVTPGIPDFWNTQNYSEIEWLSTSITSNSGDNAMGCYNEEGFIETEMDNWFVSPPFYIENGLTYPVSFYYRSFLPNHSESLTLYWGNSPESSELNNLLFEASDFTTSGWEMVEVNLVPEESGIVFLGWHAESPDGYGVFLDDITIESEIITNINEPVADEARIYSNNGNLTIEANENWAGADLIVINLMGQVVYEGKYFQPMTIQMKTHNGAGLYFVTLRKDSKVLTEKIILSGD